MKRILLILALIWTAAVALPSCDGMLDTTNANEVEENRHYGNFNDADNAILGIYGKLMSLVENVIVLGELRADLMEITENATFDQMDISNHNTPSATNKYCDVTPFYEVILNCNDAIANFDKMKAENRLSASEYAQRYSDVVTVRSWVYLQLITHFGNIPYVTDPLLTVDDLKDESKYAVKPFNEVLAALVADMEVLPMKQLSTTSPLYRSYSVDGNDMRLVLLNKNFVLGDLYLWQGNYVRAAGYYHDVITDAEINIGGDNMCYKVDGWVWNASNEPRFQVCYERYKGTDLSAYRNKWKEIFSREQLNAELRRECINVMNYDARFAPQYPLIEIFANTGKGKYQLRPTKYAIDSLWEAQVQSENNFKFDGRGRESSFDANVNGQPVVIKYLYDYYAKSTDANRTIHLDYNTPDYNKLQGRWFIYRAGLLHLRYAEAVNRAGYPDIAYAMLNGGISGAYAWALSDGSARVDRAGIRYTGYPPLRDDTVSVPYSYPFNWDARQNDAPYEYYRSPWRDNTGIRGRAFLQPVPKPAGMFPDPFDIPVATDHPAVRWMEEVILKEAALECGFEGNRWGDLLRIALRKNAEGAGGTAFLNEQLLKAKGITVADDKLFLPIGQKK